MSSKPLTPDLSVGPAPASLADASQRYRLLINLRPDEEEPGQPRSAEIAAEAQRLGLDYRHIPVVPGQIDEDQVRRFAAALAEAEGPVFAFCRTGTRACQLWALNVVRTDGVEGVLRRAAEAGYDLSALRPRLEAAAASG